MKHLKIFEDYYKKGSIVAPGVIEFNNEKEYFDYKFDNELSPSRPVYPTKEDIKRFSLFIGKPDPFYDKKSFGLFYNFKKKGIKYECTISRNKATNLGDEFFALILVILDSKGSQRKYYLAYDLESIINKIKELKKNK